MASPRIYVDHNATAPVRPEARAAALASIDAGGNASSVHAEGRGARCRLEAARKQVASLVHARPDSVVFTSGGTEAAHLALVPQVLADGAGVERLLVGATEHAAVIRGHRFAADRVERLAVDPQGVVRLDHLEALLRQGPPAMLALQAANNETGVVQPVHAAAALVRAAGGLLVCDAVQAVGRIDCSRPALGADVVLLSAHKLGGLQGAGAMVMITDRFMPSSVAVGGGQERGLRGGTENVPAIAAFGAVADIVAGCGDADRLRGLRDRFEEALKQLAPEVEMFGSRVERLPNTSCFAIPGLAAERLMMALDLGGVAVSSGSACSSGKVGRSHVLESMGVDADLRHGAVRVSFGWTSNDEEVRRLVDVLGHAIGRMRRRVLATAA